MPAIRHRHVLRQWIDQEVSEAVSYAEDLISLKDEVETLRRAESSEDQKQAVDAYQIESTQGLDISPGVGPSDEHDPDRERNPLSELNPPVFSNWLRIGMGQPGAMEVSMRQLRRGIRIPAGDNEAVHSILPGRVVFRSAVLGVGEVVLIKHHRNYVSMYHSVKFRSDLRRGDLIKHGANLGKYRPNADVQGRGVFVMLRRIVL